MNNKHNLYNILQIDKNASFDVIRKSYKKLTLIYHPDKPTINNLSKEQQTQQFIKIKDAYDILSDEEKRKKYDIATMNYVNIIDELKYKINNKEYIILINILDNKIKQILLNNTNIHKLILFTKQTNFIDLIYEIINFKLLDIVIVIDVSILQIYNNENKIINYYRVTKDIFTEIIFFLDSTQIYENEGEEIFIFGKKYSGDFIININIINTTYSNINYQILNNDLYTNIKKTNNNIITIHYFDDVIYNFDITKINKIYSDFGFLYHIPTMGLPYYDTDDNIIDVKQSSITNGDLYVFIIE
jgi:hypothetical protein